MSKSITKTLAVLSLALVFGASTGFAAGTYTPPSFPKGQKGPKQPAPAATTAPAATPAPAPAPAPSTPTKSGPPSSPIKSGPASPTGTF